MRTNVLRQFVEQLRPVPPSLVLRVAGTDVPVEFTRNLRARRFILRLTPDRVARVTVPGRGTLAEAQAFVRRQTGWLERQLARPRRLLLPAEWRQGMEILFRGEPVGLHVETRGSGCVVRLGDQVLELREVTTDVRPVMERHLWRLAARELPPRLLELAAQHQVAVRRVTVRNQRSRWGSCSRAGTVSLNWRLVQAPDFVRDYICIHELMHRREMNHSARYWQHVAEAFPQWKEAERWLKAHGSLLR